MEDFQVLHNIGPYSMVALNFHGGKAGLVYDNQGELSGLEGNERDESSAAEVIIIADAEKSVKG